MVDITLHCGARPASGSMGAFWCKNEEVLVLCVWCMVHVCISHGGCAENLKWIGNGWAGVLVVLYKGESVDVLWRCG